MSLLSIVSNMNGTSITYFFRFNRPLVIITPTDSNILPPPDLHPWLICLPPRIHIEEYDFTIYNHQGVALVALVDNLT